MSARTALKLSPAQSDLLIAAALSLGGALMRLPYLALMPVFEDEVLQTVYALSIQPKFMPLVGNDSYAGPIFSYLIAACLHVLGFSPVVPRVAAMLLGALTVGTTYWLARALGLNRVWAALVGLMLAANPHHILVSSHYAGTTYVLPLFTTVFLAALAMAVRRESGAWLVASGALLGLALQANPVPALMLPGVAVWFLVRGQRSIGLRTRWPYLAVAALVLVYAPVIIHNLQANLAGVKEAGDRLYVWQPNPSLLAYVRNLERLTFQLCRQVSGVLEGDESFRTLLGWPLLFSAWGVAGLVYAARRGLGLLALAVGSHVLIMPWLSNYYGMISRTRFTNHLTPLILAAMGALAAGGWAWARERLRRAEFARPLALGAGALLVAASLWPLVSLFRFYEHTMAAGRTNAHYFAFFDEFIQQWRGEKIFISDSLDGFVVYDEAYNEYNATEYFMAINHVPYRLMPLELVMERLAAGKESGPIVLMLDNKEVPRVQLQADLVAWDSPAMQDARARGYGVYTIPDAQQVRKPAFVLADDAPLRPTVQAIQANFADLLSVIGYEWRSDKLIAGEEVVVNVYWKTIGATSKAYTGFIHLVGPDGQLVAQDDHGLGRGIYRTNFWQPGDVIREKYTLTLPKGMPGGEYSLYAGVYDFPSLERLAVRSASVPVQNNAIVLDRVRVEP